jgi:hypothetical protein
MHVQVVSHAIHANPCRLEPTGISRKDDERRVASPGGPSRTCPAIKVRHKKTGKTILWARNYSGQLQGIFVEFLSPGIEGYSKLMGLDRGCTDGSLQRLGNFGNADFLFCQRFQFTHIGWGPRAPNGLFLLGHNGSSFYEASFYHTKKN